MITPEQVEAVKNAIMDEFLQAAATGISLLIAVGSGIWSYFTARKLNKQQQKLQMELDKASSINERLTHINNNQFDYKFDVCKNLSESSFIMCHCFTVYVQCGLLGAPEEKKKESEYMADVEKKVYSYRDMVFKYAAFIPKDLYTKFNDLLNRSWEFLYTIASNRKNNFNGDIVYIKKECQAINDDHQKLTEELREYLEKLARGEENA